MAVSYPQTSHASIPLRTATPPQQQQRQALRQLGVRTKDSATIDSHPQRETVREEIDAVMSLMQEGTAAADRGEWTQALDKYTQIIEKYSDLALAERARISRALLMYQVGQVEDALLQLEDEEVALRGAAEVHAALAAILYTERPAQVGRAEEQWAIATGFDRRYADEDWVRTQRRWPPRMMTALQKFLNLSP